MRKVIRFKILRKVLAVAPNANLKLNRRLCRLHRINVWGPRNIQTHRIYLRTQFKEIWPSQKSIIDKLPRQYRKSEKAIKPIKKAISPMKPATVELHLGKLKAWHPKYTDGFIIFSDEDNSEIPVSKEQFRQGDIASLREGTKVKYEKDENKDGLQAVNVVIVKE